MSIGFIKVGNFRNGRHAPVRDFKTVKEHLKYIGFRSREIVLGQERFFTGTKDRADWRDFYEGVANHRALQHSDTIKIHKVIFSLRDIDYEAYQNSGRDYKDIVRSVLKRYEDRRGVKLEWIAARHDQNNHPHCHVVIRGVTKDGPNGRCRRVFLTKDDIQKIKRDFDNEVSRHREYKREPVLNRDIDRERPYLERKFDKELERPDSFASLFNQFQKAMERRQREIAREGERERQREDRGRRR